MTDRITILVKSDPADEADWLAAMRRYMPDADILGASDCQSPDRIDYALLWQPGDDLLASLSRVRVLFSLGAGVDHILRCANCPADVPIVRLVDPLLTEGMTHYLVYQVLRIHRRMDRYEDQQRHRTWQAHVQRPAADCPVGLLGHGALGAHAAAQLRRLGFPVQAWSRTPKPAPWARLTGTGGLHELLRNSHIVIVLLPLTDATRGLLGRGELEYLRPDAWLINVGRGPVVDQRALLDALRRRQLGGACLDVFEREPLPVDDPLWRHPAVSLTPHVASLTTPSSAARIIAEQIDRHRKGETLRYRVDPNLGY